MKRRGNQEGSIYEYRDGFAGQVRIGARRHTFYGKTRREVQGKIRAVVTDSEKGVMPAPENLTLERYFDRWLEDAIKNGVAARTSAIYAYHVRDHILPSLGKQKLKGLKATDLQRLYTQLLGRGLAPKTVKNVHGVIRKALGQAVAWGLAPTNVALAAKPPRVERRELETLSAAEVRRMWASVAGTRWKPFLILAIKTGLRQGELLGLKWDDIDFDAGTLQVRRQLQRDKTFAAPKGRRQRRLDLGALELRALAAHRAQQDERRRQWGAAWAGQELIFTTDQGRPLGWRDVDRDFKLRLAKAGIKAIRFHDLRHTNATLQLEAGIHPKVVQERLGHSDIGVTLDIYSHVTPTLGRDAAQRLDAVFDDGAIDDGNAADDEDGTNGAAPASVS